METKTSFAMPMFLDMHLVKYTDIKLEVPFNVTLSSAGFQCLGNPGTLFTTGDGDLQFGLIYNNATRLEGNWKLTQIAEPYILNE